MKINRLVAVVLLVVLAALPAAAKTKKGATVPLDDLLIDLVELKVNLDATVTVAVKALQANVCITQAELDAFEVDFARMRSRLGILQSRLPGAPSCPAMRAVEPQEPGDLFPASDFVPSLQSLVDHALNTTGRARKDPNECVTQPFVADVEQAVADANSLLDTIFYSIESAKPCTP